MTAYDFEKKYNPSPKTRARVQRTCVCQDVANMIVQQLTSKGVDYRKKKDYKESKRLFIELTMSCDEQEAIRWMEHWMAKAMAYGIETQNLDWQTKFMAARDIWCDIVE